MHARMFYSTAAAAERLSLSPRTLEQYRRTGEGPAFHRFGSRVRYLDEDLDEWAAARRRESMARKGGEFGGTVGRGRRKSPRRAPLGGGAGTKAPSRAAPAGRAPARPARDYVNGSRTAGHRGTVGHEPARTMGRRKLKSGT